MQTLQNQITLTLIKCGEYLRIGFKPTCDMVTHNQFANLRWMCQERNETIDDATFFYVRKEKLTSVIKAFRSPLRFKTKNFLKSSPFRFEVQPSTQYMSTDTKTEFNLGEQDNYCDNPWVGYKSQAGKLFDAVA